jgi:hypothetical protein
LLAKEAFCFSPASCEARAKVIKKKNNKEEARGAKEIKQKITGGQGE